MKGFIEVTPMLRSGKPSEVKSLLLNISGIYSVRKDRDDDKMTMIRNIQMNTMCDIWCAESLDEIKAKIREAQ